MKNSRILEIIENKTISIAELKDLGFTNKQYIKSDSRNSNALMGKVSYHHQTYYANYTLVADHDKVSVIKNDLTEKQAEQHNKLRNEKIKLEGLKNQIHAYRFEFKDESTAKELEKRIPIQEAKIKAIEISINLVKAKKE